MLAYLIAAVAALSILAGIGYRVRESGKDAVRLEWASATAKATAAADAERQRQDALRQQQDKEATRRLANEKKRSAALMDSLEAHIRASGAAAQCAVPPSLLDDWNRANAGPESPSAGTVPSTGRPATTPR